MGNKNSAISKAHGGQGANVASVEPHYVVSMQRKLSTKSKMGDLWVFPIQPHDMKPLESDETFTNFIQHAKYKIRSLSHINEEQSNPAPADVAYGTSTNRKEDERDHFSEFIENARKKLRTISRKNSSFGREYDREH